jgi:hypothetical protein
VWLGVAVVAARGLGAAVSSSPEKRWRVPEVVPYDERVPLQKESWRLETKVTADRERLLGEIPMLKLFPEKRCDSQLILTTVRLFRTRFGDAPALQN